MSSTIKIEKDNVLLTIKEEDFSQYKSKGFSKVGEADKASSNNGAAKIAELESTNLELTAKIAELESTNLELTAKIAELESTNTKEIVEDKKTKK